MISIDQDATQPTIPIIGIDGIIPQELPQGNIVEQGDFGNFWLRSRADGAETSDKVNADLVTNLLPRFNPSKEFKKVLDPVEFEK